jgi:hypothetical protein
MKSHIVRVIIGIVLLSQQIHSAVIFDDTSTVLTIDSQVNDFVEIRGSISVELLSGASVTPSNDGRQTSAIDVGTNGCRDTKLIVKGGTVTGISGNYGGAAINLNGGTCELVVEGGAIQGGDSSASLISAPSGQGIVMGRSSVATISGGTVAAGSSNSRTAILIRGSSPVTTLTITGGNIEGDIETVGTCGSGQCTSTIDISGGNFVSSDWKLGGQATTINVEGCIQYDPQCGSNYCPLTGVLADGSPIQVRVAEENGINNVQLLNTCAPTESPSFAPTPLPSSSPTLFPSTSPSAMPSMNPSSSTSPSAVPSTAPSDIPSPSPSFLPTTDPTSEPTFVPSFVPSNNPSSEPSGVPSSSPSFEPTLAPSGLPSSKPSPSPSAAPSRKPSNDPSSMPSSTPTTPLLDVNAATGGAVQQSFGRHYHALSFLSTLLLIILF